MIVLGNKNAAVSSLGIQIEGQLAYIARRLIYLHRLPTQKKTIDYWNKLYTKVLA